MERDEADLRGEDIICLGCVEWLVIRSVAEYTMLGFSSANRILFVEPFGSFITLARVARWQNRTPGRRRSIRQVAPNIWVYRPAAIGFPGMTRWRWVGIVNGWILALLLRVAARRLGFRRRPILWSFLYNAASTLRTFPARLKIYECGDEDEAMARDERARAIVRSHEAAICRAADLVFAVTEELSAKRRTYGNEVFTVNCAASHEIFGRALLPETRVPEDLARLPHPVIGYLGSVDPWKIDFAILSEIARAHPEWSIALVGYVWFGFDAKLLAEFPNVHLLGKKEYDAFPDYLKGMDVCMMPFPLNGITVNGDALKLYEYLAGGRPVVSTDVPAARRLAEVVRIAATPAAFVAAIEASLDDTAEKKAERLAAVAPHSWANRNRDKARLVLARLAERR